MNGTIKMELNKGNGTKMEISGVNITTKMEN